MGYYLTQVSGDNLVTSGAVAWWCRTGLSQVDGSCWLLRGDSKGGNPRLCTGFVNIGRSKVQCNERETVSVATDITGGERCGLT